MRQDPVTQHIATPDEWELDRKNHFMPAVICFNFPSAVTQRLFLNFSNCFTRIRFDGFNDRLTQWHFDLLNISSE